ncbi:S-layer homology domain-containing protein [Anaerobacillus sp. MEB173]|uniref:S-layer homology domain-containing protein n=1 Tax=Anaerobacillus sp. MEB173 TaxID=3383345 RepID=UPI003F8FD228
MRKFLFFLIVLGLLISPSMNVFASDDLQGHSLEQEMRAVIELGIIKGYREGVYAPNDDVTRAQFATFLVRALKLPSGTANVEFTDVPKNYLLADGIYRAAAAGIVGGYPNQEFKPEQKISREQMAVMIDRALQYKNIKRTPVHLSFTDTTSIAPSFRQSVAHNAYFGIIRGNPAGNGNFKFEPKQNATRAHAAAFINRMLTVIDTNGERVVNYQIANVSSTGQVSFKPEQYMTYNDAVSAMADNQVLFLGQDVVKMNGGIAAAAPPQGQFIVIIYEADMKKQLTYVVAGTELRYLDADENKVKVQIADTIGYVKQNDVQLKPSAMLTGRSYYRNVNNELVHYVYNPLTEKYVSYIMGPAPSFLKENTNYYSWDGKNYFSADGVKVGEEVQFFNRISLRTKSNYTAEQLNEYVAAMKPESPLKELGHAFKEAEEKYNVNALYLLGKAIHESNWGLSEIAQTKKNLFGIRATDSDPLRNAEEFKTFAECIDYLANYVSQRYMTEGGWFFNGAVLGDKGIGLNVNYASDPYWGQKIAGHMYRVDKHLGQLDSKDAKIVSTIK